MTYVIISREDTLLKCFQKTLFFKRKKKKALKNKTALLTSRRFLSFFLDKHSIFRLFMYLTSSDITTKYLQD